MTGSRDDSPDPQVAGGRPRYNGSSEPEFSTGDKVYLLKGGTKTGPYKVESVTDGGQFTLCEIETGTSLNNGDAVDASDLEKAT
ncbi:hypothetical protein F5Y05DRAFT_264877 [Hypoxylon sp. FL0543]|nr:hypothetical protein F5Y05DRAFT_264877 [Hypoxylon sp. FL0543]